MLLYMFFFIITFSNKSNTVVVHEIITFKVYDFYKTFTNELGPSVKLLFLLQVSLLPVF